MSDQKISLNDRLDLSKSQILLNGTQALVRLMLMQAARDKAAGHNTAGYVTGYRGSPLGAVDLQMARAEKQLAEMDAALRKSVDAFGPTGEDPPPALRPGEGAEALLGRPYWMSGRIAHGDKRGRTIGFPTANIFLHRNAVPVDGVFAVELCGIDNGPIPGVANVGTRPTVDGSRALLEVHLFDFDRDIYGCHVRVSFMKKLRPERRFESFEHLKRQIEVDAERARAFFAQTAA